MEPSDTSVLTNKTALENDLEAGVLKTLLYFDVFYYPLTLQEIKDNCRQIYNSPQDLEAVLEELVSKKIIKKQNDFYFINEDNSIVERRQNGNLMADKFYKAAFLFSRLISWFPFVKGVCISGSLSKGYMEKDSDIDYFIITSPSRLWLCRTLLVLFKKVFLLNSKKYFCVNYFIDTEHLAIPDKNLFAATELAFIHPTYNHELYMQFMKTNSWFKEFYPNKKEQENTKTLPQHKFFLKHFLEILFNGKAGEMLDNWCFRLTLKYWKKKFKNFDAAQFDLHLRSKKEVSKHHPNGFQIKVLAAYQIKIKEFQSRHSISLDNTI